MLSGITITCFAASYAITLAAEVSRLFFRAPVRMLIILGFTGAGLLAHFLYLVAQARHEVSAGPNIVPLSSWYDWCLLAAFVVAAAYFGLTVRRMENAIGVFLLPLVLGLIGVAVWVDKQNVPAFPREAALSYWRVIHGIALLMGTVAVTLGFAAGVMYLVQAYRLKHKLPPRPGFKLPNLEWLERFNRRSLLLSTGFLAIGLLSGIVMNLGGKSKPLPWSDPVVISSGVLFLWLIVAAVFEWVYKPARQGKKVAYLTLASFVFLAAALTFVLWGQHATAVAS